MLSSQKLCIVQPQQSKIKSTLSKRAKDLPDQMIDEDYPLRLPGMMDQKYLDYAFTKEFYDEASGDSPLFAVDCEMVRTKEGLELAR